MNNEIISNVKDNHRVIVDKMSDYHKRIAKYRKEKNYDSTFCNLYYKGKIIFDNKEYEIYDFYLTYNFIEDDSKVRLVCSKENYSDILLKETNKYNYKSIIQLRETSIFTKMIEENVATINDNKLTIVDKDKLLFLVNNWDGMVHDKVPETDAIENKNCFKK